MENPVQLAVRCGMEVQGAVGKYMADEGRVRNLFSCRRAVESKNPMAIVTATQKMYMDEGIKILTLCNELTSGFWRALSKAA